VKRFLLLGIEKLMKAGLSGDAAVPALVTLEGTMLAATLLDDPALFEQGTAAIV